MRFKVPQFIDVEDKLFGPFTFYQFAYLAGGAGIVFVTYKLLPLWIGIFIMIPVAGLSLLLVFYRINDKPFMYYLQAGINYYIGKKLYIWKQRLAKPSDKKEDEIEVHSTVGALPMMSEKKLQDLSWSLDLETNQTDTK